MSSAVGKEKESETMFQGAGCKKYASLMKKSGISDPKNNIKN